MRTIYLIVMLVLLSFMFAIVVSPAQASCSLIKDNDKRQACYAERDDRPSRCALIKNEDDRQLCRARASR